MKIQMTLNGKKITEEIQPGMLLLDFVRAHGCKSVKRGCETANCGLCTVFVDDKPVLSCSTLVARVSGHKVDTSGRTAGGSGGVRCIYRQSGSRTVRFL